VSLPFFEISQPLLPLCRTQYLPKSANAGALAIVTGAPKYVALTTVAAIGVHRSRRLMTRGGMHLSKVRWTVRPISGLDQFALVPTA
jgi:hypothetical protein